jgi:hypothetical protein
MTTLVKTPVSQTTSGTLTIPVQLSQIKTMNKQGGGTAAGGMTGTTTTTTGGTTGGVTGTVKQQIGPTVQTLGTYQQQLISATIAQRQQYLQKQQQQVSVTS